MVLREVKDQLTTVATRTTESVGNGDEHEELKEPYRRSVLARQRRLTGVGRSGGRRRESGPNQGDAAAGLMKTRGATAAAVAELEQRSNGARRKRESVRRKCWAGLFIRPSHKWARDSRRPRRDYLPLMAPRFSEGQ